VRDGLPITFLIVEDEAVIAMDLELMIADAGGRPVGLAATAADAERLAGVLRPDVILMDVRLKGERDGIAAAYAIREALGTPIVFVTGNEEAETVGRIRAVNGSSPVHKPVRASALIDAVLEALSGSRHGKQSPDTPLQ
jgi:AmiR/NasT family two-component response regulator